MKGNPFTITFGKQPNLLISRGEEVDRIISVFTSENPLTQSFLLEGIRGSGKTVLMTTVGKELHEEDDWIVVNLNSSRNLLDDLARNLSNVVRRLPNVFKQGVNVSIAGFGFGIGAAEENLDRVSIIENIL